ncbi:MAG: ImmA/IrrE family metallo-endopeptidase [Acidobacteriota bacterium]
MLLRLILVALLFAASAAAQTSELFSQVPQILEDLSAITGWKVKRSVPSELLTKEKFAQIAEQGVIEAERDKDTRATELTLKMFGLVPWDFNLARESADLITEQAAAFYDIRKKRLFILESSASSSEQRVALAHELAHALADQQYDLRKFMSATKNDDAITARQSVVEGQASWLSWAYMAKQAGGRAEVPRRLLDELSNVGATGEDFPVFSQTPLYMRESLTFPYTEGMRFQDALYRKLGAPAFDRVFRDAPLSTQEILHPDDYADGLVPTHPDLPDLKILLGKDSRQVRSLTGGDVGEFDYSAILRQHTGRDQDSDDQARKTATHWRGGTFGLYEYKKTQKPLLVHTSEWDSPEAAREFFRLYVETLRHKWKRMDVAQSSETEISGSGDPGDFLIRIHGVYVECIEGMRVK